MTYDPIKTLDVANYGCIKSARLELSALHCFIGPNDSGKSTILRAVRVATQFAGGTFDKWDGQAVPFDPRLDGERRGTKISLRYADGAGYQLHTVSNGKKVPVEEVFESLFGPTGGSSVPSTKRNAWRTPGALSQPTPVADHLRPRITPATMIRFDPNALRDSSRQILSDQAIQFADETGIGLASVYQAINSRDVDAFVDIRNRARQLFPTFKNLQVPPEANGMVGLRATLIDDTEVPAAALSEGLLYFLGYAALRYLNETRTLLVEEPENGLHPTRIAEVMTILREISKKCQVLIATHSPLVVNELQGHEITVVTRDPQEGTRGTLLKDVPGFEAASQVYAPGEFWLSYADGKMDEPLLTGTPRT